MDADELLQARHSSKPDSVAFDAWHRSFSADHAIVWKDIAKAGDRLTLRFRAEKTGPVEVLLKIGQIFGGGSYRIFIDRKEFPMPIDVGTGLQATDAKLPVKRFFFKQSRYATKVEEISLGRTHLDKGDHTFSIEALRPGGPELTFLLNAVRLRDVDDTNSK